RFQRNEEMDERVHRVRSLSGRQVMQEVRHGRSRLFGMRIRKKCAQILRSDTGADLSEHRRLPRRNTGLSYFIARMAGYTIQPSKQNLTTIHSFNKRAQRTETNTARP